MEAINMSKCECEHHCHCHDAVEDCKCGNCVEGTCECKEGCACGCHKCKRRLRMWKLQNR